MKAFATLDSHPTLTDTTHHQSPLTFNHIIRIYSHFSYRYWYRLIRNFKGNLYF